MRHKISNTQELSDIVFDDDENSTIKVRIFKIVKGHLPEDVTISLPRRTTILALENMIQRMKQVK